MSFLALLCAVSDPWVALHLPRSFWDLFRLKSSRQKPCVTLSLTLKPGSQDSGSLYFSSLTIFLLSFPTYKLDAIVAPTLLGCYEG